MSLDHKCLSLHEKRLILDAYADLTERVVRSGWEALLVTCLYKHIDASHRNRVEMMNDEWERIYKTFLTRCVKNPRKISSQGQLPILIASPDFPVPKTIKRGLPPLRYSSSNDGMHSHGILLVPPKSRLKSGAKQHFYESESIYIKNNHKLINLDVAELKENSGYVTKYALKSIGTTRSSLDDIFVLPKSRSEFAQKRATSRW